MVNFYFYVPITLINLTMVIKDKENSIKKKHELVHRKQKNISFLLL